MYQSRPYSVVAAFVALTLGTVLMSNDVALQADDELTKVYEAAKFESPAGMLLYRWMKPAKLDSNASTGQGSAKYPLVIFLHGAGERGDDNVAQLKHCAVEFTKAERREKYPAFVVFPQCPKNEKWAEVDWSQKEVRFPKETGKQMTLVLQLVDKIVAEQPIDKQRIYIAGLSMGGYGTWNAVGTRPDFWAAAIPVCGGADVEWASQLSKTPLWVFHGNADTAVPVENSRKIVEKLKAVKAPVTYTEYDGVGHDSWTQTFKNDEVHEWLFKQRR